MKEKVNKPLQIKHQLVIVYVVPGNTDSSLLIVLFADHYFSCY